MTQEINPFVPVNHVVHPDTTEFVKILKTTDDKYSAILEETLNHGEIRSDRTGTGTISIFGGSARFDAEGTVPLLTRKKVAVRSCIAELVWFIIGSKDANLLSKLKSPIWDAWKLKEDHYTSRRLSVNEMMVYAAAELNTSYEQISKLCRAEDATHEGGHPYGTMAFLKRNNIDEWDSQLQQPAGFIGPMYGAEWNRVPTGFMKSKLEILLDGLKNRPFARDHLLVAWNDDVRPIYDDARFGETNDEIIENNLKCSRQPIPPCHFASQFYMHEDGMGTGTPESISLQFHMRSADLFLGVPFNILSYGILLHLVARHLGVVANSVSVTFGDRHIYTNHVEQVKEYLSRKDEALYNPTFELPHQVPDILEIQRMSHTDIDALNDLVDLIASGITNYTPQSFIAAPVSK